MEVSGIISEIDSQILKLQQARALLSEAGSSAGASVKRAGRGRPKGSKNSAKKASAGKATAASPVKAKRKLSPEGRKAIAEAMKRRWAENREQAGK